MKRRTVGEGLLLGLRAVRQPCGLPGRGVGRGRPRLGPLWVLPGGPQSGGTEGAEFG